MIEVKMKKLTTEQAQWLIKEINVKLLLRCLPPGECDINRLIGEGKFCYEPTNIVEIINQCTEKEFPDIDITWDSPSFLSSVDNQDQSIKIHFLPNYGFNIILDAHSHRTFFDNKTFKEFADGINEIVKWLEEQEENG